MFFKNNTRVYKKYAIYLSSYKHIEHVSPLPPASVLALVNLRCSVEPQVALLGVVLQLKINDHGGTSFHVQSDVVRQRTSLGELGEVPERKTTLVSSEENSKKNKSKSFN